MRFTSYEPAVDPQVMHPPAVRAPGDVYAYGTGGEEYAKMAAAIGQVNKVAAQRQDDLDAADVMQARNEMMTRLTEQLYGENGLFTTGVGEHAKGLMQRTTAAINETFADVGKKYNARVQFALKGNLNENMANFQRIAASKEMAEQKALAKESLAANLSGNVQQAALTWQVNGAPTMYVKSGERLLLAQAQREGWSGEMLASERQKMVTDVAAAAAGAAIENEDYERADEILFWMRNDMDASVYYKLAREGKKKRVVREMDADVSRILSLPDVWDGQHFNQAKAREYVDEVYGKDALLRLIEARGGDLERSYEDERKEFLDGVLRAAQNAGGYGEAISVLYAQELDMRERNALEGAIAAYYHVNKNTGRGAGEGRGRKSDGPTEKEARAAYNKLQVLSMPRSR